MSFIVEKHWKTKAGLSAAVLMVRNGAFRCGYVGVPTGHPAHGKGYDDLDVDVHGGLTYSAGVKNKYPFNEDLWWLGFDCAHLGDATGWGGSDGDIFRSQEYVEGECERLAEQLAAMQAAL